jgi:hypothetical protein
MTNNSDAMQLPLATLVVIDAQVDDYEVLLNGVVDGASTLLLDPRRDGVEQITEALAASATPISSLHIVSHGSPGTLYLGSTQLSLDTLAHYAPQLSRWFAASPRPRVPASSSTPSLLLYGCNVAAGDAGEEFVAKVHNLTRANVAASTKLVGNSNLSGSWDLNFYAGDTSVSSPFEQEVLRDYAGVFALIDINEQTDLNGQTSATLNLGGNTITYTSSAAGTFIDEFECRSFLDWFRLSKCH